MQSPKLNKVIQEAVTTPTIWITPHFRVLYMVLEINESLKLRIDYRLPSNTEGSTGGTVSPTDKIDS
jgi:hypothetical protein